MAHIGTQAGLYTCQLGSHVFYFRLNDYRLTFIHYSQLFKYNNMELT